jgi:hypothetical protein
MAPPARGYVECIAIFSMARKFRHGWRWLMRNRVLRLIVLTFALAAVLTPSGASLAEDYRFAFGVDTKHGQDFGSVTCVFDEVCSARMESLDLRVTIHIIRSDPRRAHVRLYGRDISCCYFAEAADSIIVDPQKPPSRLPFFSGGSARGGLHIENEYAGTLYLRFHSH